MPKILKLVGLKDIISPATNNELVKKGEICRFTDEHADKLNRGKRIDKEGEEVKYWEEMDEDFDMSKLTYDFVPPEKTSAPPAAAPAPNVSVRNNVESATEEEAPTRVSRTQRATATQSRRK